MMAELFANKYAPQTFAVGYLNCDFNRVVEASEKWLSELGWTESERFNSTLDSALDRMEPVNLGRQLVITTKSKWTAVFDSYGDIVATTRSLAKRCGCEAVMINYREDQSVRGTNTGLLGSCQFETFTGAMGSRTFSNERAVALVNEGSAWRFHEHGDVQPYERTETYKSRRKRDRFPVGLLIEYCRALEIDPFNEDFYGRSCALFSQAKSLPPGTHHESRAESLAKMAGTWRAEDWAD